MAMSRATAAAGQRLNGGAPAGPPLDDTLDENGHLRNETMLTLLQQLEESLMGMGDGGRYHYSCVLAIMEAENA
jgi:hypothetical protein